MITIRSQFVYGAALFAAVLCGLTAAPSTARAQEHEAPDADKIPANVMETLKDRFPYAVIHKWTREEENDLVLYDIEFTQQGLKFEADIIEDGRIHNWERAIAAPDLPEIVMATVTRDYPGSTMKEIMVITTVEEGEESLEGYEIVLHTADGDELEILVAPDGTVLEEGAP